MRSTIRSVDVIVRGRVQGVGFRWFVAREAAALDITGWVENRADGSVDARVEGPQEDVDRMIAALRDGPPGADVVSVEVTELAAAGRHDRFEIRSRWHTGD